MYLYFECMMIGTIVANFVVLRRTPALDRDFLIVLGCGLRPDGSPSLMLRHRINAACDYLTAHPEAVCVASGCQAGDECISEARCIQNTLLSLGIAPERIYLEERSRSTRDTMPVRLWKKARSSTVSPASVNSCSSCCSSCSGTLLSRAFTASRPAEPAPEPSSSIKISATSTHFQ